MNKVQLKEPIYSYYLSYLRDTLVDFSSKLKDVKQPHIVNTYPYSVLTLLKTYPAVIGVFLGKVERSNERQSSIHKQDTIYFYIDTYTCPLENKEDMNFNTQEEASYRMAMYYSNWVRQVVTDVSVAIPHYNDDKNVSRPMASNLYWLSATNIQNADLMEKTVTCIRQEFVIDMPFYTTDSNIYEALVDVLVKVKVEGMKNG